MKTEPILKKIASQIMSYFNEVDIGQPDFVDIESSLTWKPILGSSCDIFQ